MKSSYCKLSMASIAACLLMWGCADENLTAPDSGRSHASDTQLVISLAVPDQEEASETRAAMTPEGAEGKINDLRMIAFGYDGGSSVVNQVLPFGNADSMPISPEGFANFEIKGFTPGAYAVYIIANMGTSLANVKTESELKNIITDYSSTLPTPGNLPMIYEPSARIAISKTATEPAYLEAMMTIAAVKVKYSIIFDKKNCGDVFGDAGLRITGVKISDAAKRSYLVANTADTDPGLRDVTPTSQYFSAYTENQGNASISNKDVITVSGSGANTATYTSTWVYRGTAYLPERYVASSGTPTSMTISAVVTDPTGKDGNVSNKYVINLAAYDGAPNEKSMPRGQYYEVIGKIMTLGDAKLDASIQCKKWEESLISVNFAHTYLSVNKTHAKVESLVSDELTYDTDGRGAPGFVCDNKINGVPVVKGTYDTSAHKLKLEVNSDVNVANLADGQGKGTADCWVTAGNIRKQIKVDYDITPFFIIKPLETKVQWGTTNTKEYSYRTNLGGIMICADGAKGTVRIGNNGSSVIKSYTNTIATANIRKSELLLECADPTASEGVVTVTAKCNPESTTMHEFDAYPAMARTLAKYDTFKGDMKVTVMPPLGDYRIYFRAINDWQIFNGGTGTETGQWLEGKDSNGSDYPTEYYGTNQQNNNWIDYWYCKNQYDEDANGNAASNNRYPHEDSHRIYIWTQTGETLSWNASPPVWRFTPEYKYSAIMKQDYTNAGWYYYDLPVKKTPDACSGGASGTKYPEPGTTLMIFNNHTNAGPCGFSVHRVAEHLAPGIPLFDYEDREGWVLFDPTYEGFYRIYDERPYIKDVTYTIYSDAKPTGWWRKYGVAQQQPPSGSGGAQYTIWSNNVQGVSTKNINGKTYYVYTIQMKAVQGDYAKAININFETVAGTTTVVTPPQRIYYYSKNGWSNPKVYIYDGGNQHTNWDNSPAMIKGHSENGYYYYYYDVPSGFSNARVIFRDGNSSAQYPAQNAQGLALEGKTKCYNPSNNNSWAEFTPPTTTTTTPGTKISSKIFGGRAFPDNTGYFNSSTKTWTAGKPQ